MSRFSRVALLMASLLACSGGSTEPAAPELVGRFAVVELGGKALPIQVIVGGRLHSEIIADTLSFGADGRFIETVVRRYPQGTPDQATSTWPGSYTRAGSQVSLTFDAESRGVRTGVLVGATLSLDRGETPPDVFTRVP